jgi:hypothetical protein
MEFFDPKTRPVALFWDSDALMTAPLSWCAPPPLPSTGARWSTWARRASRRCPKATACRPSGCRSSRCSGSATRAIPTPRIAACAASFLQNRDADVGGSFTGGLWVTRVVYAFATAIFQLHPHVGQGEANTAVTGAVIRSARTARSASAGADRAGPGRLA